MIHICTLKYGTKYNSKNVNNLYNSIKRDCKEFKFHCLTDDALNLHPDINIITFEKDFYDFIHWNKLRFYDGNFINAKIGDEIVILDIDQEFIGDASKIIEYPVQKNEHLFAYRWWAIAKEVCPINAGVQKFLYDGSQKYVFDKFIENPDKWLIYYYWYYGKIKVNEKVRRLGFGEQNFIFDTMKNTHKIVYFPKKYVIRLDFTPDQFEALKHKYNNEFSADLIVNNQPNPESVLVHYTGEGNDVLQKN